MNPKNKRLVNKHYLEFIRQQPCLIIGSVPSVAHHIRMNLSGGMGLKPSDYMAVPLHPHEHRSLHQYGEKRFWTSIDFTIKKLTMIVW